VGTTLLFFFGLAVIPTRVNDENPPSFSLSQAVFQSPLSFSGLFGAVEIFCFPPLSPSPLHIIFASRCHVFTDMFYPNHSLSLFMNPPCFFFESAVVPNKTPFFPSEWPRQLFQVTPVLGLLLYVALPKRERTLPFPLLTNSVSPH